MQVHQQQHHPHPHYIFCTLLHAKLLGRMPCPTKSNGNTLLLIIRDAALIHIGHAHTHIKLDLHRDGRKGPPAGSNARCNRTNTPHSKATQCKAKPNETPQTHTRGARQAKTTSAKGRARQRVGARPAPRVATYVPDRQSDALYKIRCTVAVRSIQN
jgi:hypothetical protein